MPKTNNTSRIPANSGLKFQKRVFGVKAALILLLALACFLPACKKSANDNGSHDLSAALSKSSSKPNTEETSSDLTVKGGLAEKVLLTAYSQVGARYRFGGTNPQAGFDCSGFTRWVYAQNGIDLPRSSSEQFQIGRPVAKEDVKPGDLLIYKRYRNSKATHVGIYVGNGKYIHSPSKGKTVQENEAFTGSAGARFLGARRVFDDPSSCALTAEQKIGAAKNYVASIDDREARTEFKAPATKEKTKVKSKSKSKSKSKGKATKTAKTKNSNKSKSTASKAKSTKKS